MPGPLHGIRVLDMSTVLLGPYATQTLGDMGADIIKIESPTGDTSRDHGPRRNKGMAATFLDLNRNKRSLVLDLKRPAALKAFLKLVSKADVVFHNLRPAPANRLGIGYQRLAEINPRIIVANAVGYGRAGSYRDRAAYDDLIQASCGLASLVGANVGSGPRYVPTALADKITGLMVVNAISMALFHRERTGEGQEVEIPMYETLVSFLLKENTYGLAFDPPLEPRRYERMLSPFRRAHRTKDGFIAALPYTDEHWRRFFAMGGRPELADDPRFASLGLRTQNFAPIYDALESILIEKTTAEWTRLLEDAGIPVAPVNDLDQLLNDPHLVEAGMFEVVDHPTEGRVLRIRSPMVFSKTPASYRRDTPRLGENSVEVLAEAGLDRSEIDALLADKSAIDGR